MKRDSSSDSTHTPAPVAAQRRACQKIRNIRKTSQHDHRDVTTTPTLVSVAKHHVQHFDDEKNLRHDDELEGRLELSLHGHGDADRPARTPTGTAIQLDHPAPIMVMVIKHPPAVLLLLLDPPPRPPDIVVHKVLVALLQEVDVPTSRRRPRAGPPGGPRPFIFWGKVRKTQ